MSSRFLDIYSNESREYDFVKLPASARAVRECVMINILANKILNTISECTL